jgi:hypothetical protein
MGYFLSNSSAPRLRYSSSSALPGADSAAIARRVSFHPFFRDVHADALANVIGLASGLETGTAQHVAEAFPREIDRGIYQVGGRAAQSRFDAPLFVLLGGAVVDLEDRGVLQQFGQAVGPRIESGAQDHQLRRPAADGALHQLVDEARPHQHQPGEAEDIGIVNGFLKILVESLLMGWSAIRANSAGPISRSAIQSGLRTLASGSRDPNARAAAVRIEVREGNPLASIQELSNISGLHPTVNEPARTAGPGGPDNARRHPERWSGSATSAKASFKRK